MMRRRALRVRPVRRVWCAAVLLAVLFVGCGGAGDAPSPVSSELLRAPDVYASKGGVLHLRVKTVTKRSEIAGKPYEHMDVYETSLVDGQGVLTKGNASEYVGAEWSVKPGDRLIVDYINGLDKARFTQAGADEASLVPQPINLHTHGLTVSPSGNSDNVLLAIPRGRSNRFVIDIPKTQYHGLYWYHPHIHGLTDEQVYDGLAGHIVVGRADGDYRQFDDLRVQRMMIRYNVLDAGTAAGEKDELVDASPYDTQGTALKPPQGPERGRMIYTVNGQLRPRIKMRAARDGQPAESQVWAMTNITGSASYILALDEIEASKANDPNAVGRRLDFTIVAEDGTPMPRPQVLKAADGGYLLGQGGRVAILVQGPSDPTKVVRLLQVQNRSGTGDASAFDARPDSATKGPIGGWRDYTRDVLATAVDAPAATRPHVDTPKALTTNYTQHNARLDRVDHRRTFHFNSVAPSRPEQPNDFPVNDDLFLFNRVDHPKAGTVEEWTIFNDSSLHHPFHVHTQYGKVMQVVAPINQNYKDPAEYPSLQYVSNLSQPRPAEWTQDVVNLPPAKVETKGGNPIAGKRDAEGHQRALVPGKVVLRLRFEDYLGTYVEHCHRLPHEDRGMMSLVRTIPHDPVYAVSAGPRVTVLRSSDNGRVRTIVPFGRRQHGLSTAFGDVDGDAVPDLAVATGGGRPTAVKIYSGASGFAKVTARLLPFGSVAYGASVALGDLNADGRDDIVVGLNAGPAVRAAGDVAIFDGETGHRLADFHPYGASFDGGVSVATGMLEAGGRISLVTGAGAGRPAVKVFNFDLFGNDKGVFPNVRDRLTPLNVATFDGAAPTNEGGVTVATGDPYAAAGGFSNILVNPRAGGGQVQIFSLEQHHPVGQKDVATSGVSRPHDYEPGAPRMAMPARPLALGSHRAVDVGTLSTWTGAQVLVVPRAGGAVRLWQADDHGVLSPKSTLKAKGTGVSGI